MKQHWLVLWRWLMAQLGQAQGYWCSLEAIKQEMAKSSTAACDPWMARSLLVVAWAPLVLFLWQYYVEAYLFVGLVAGGGRVEVAGCQWRMGPEWRWMGRRGRDVAQGQDGDDGWDKANSCHPSTQPVIGSTTQAKPPQENTPICRLNWVWPKVNHPK